MLRGAGSLIGSRIVGLGFTVVQIKLAVSYLGPSEYGLLSTAVLLVGTFEVFTELGLSNIVVRRVSGGADLAHTVGLAKGIALIMMLPLAGSAILTGYILYDDPVVLQGVAIVSMGLSATIWAYTFVPVAQVRDRFGGISAADVAGRVVSLTVIAAAVLSHRGLTAFFVAQLVAPVTRAVVCHVWGRRQGFFPPLFRWLDMGGLVKEALPLTYIASVSGLYFQLDGLLLTKLATPLDVGAYNFAYRIIVNLNIIGTAIAAVLMVRYSQAAATGVERFRHVLRLSTAPMLLLCLPVACLLWPFSADVIRLLGSEDFVPISTHPLTLLWIAASISLLTTVISSALVAGHAQKFLASLNTVNLVLNLALNVILIPRYGALGAAIALICTEASGLVACLIALTRRLGTFVPLRQTLTLGACAVAGIFVEQFSHELPWLLRGLLVAAVFFGLAFLSRAVTLAELRELSQGIEGHLTGPGPWPAGVTDRPDSRMGDLSEIPLIGLVVVNYGSSDLLERHLVGLTATLGASAVTVVVDNPTTSDERMLVERLAAARGWIIERPYENVGFGGGVNLGANRALAEGADVLLLLNPDASIDSLSVRRLVDVVSADPMTLAAPIIFDSTGNLWFDGAGLDPRTGRIVTSDHLGEPGIEPWLTGACLAVSEQLWRAVGGFNEHYFLYWEDVALSRRVRETGGRLQLVPGATAVHDEGGTQGLCTGSRRKSDTYYYYNIRNRMLYASEFLTPAARRRWLLRSVPEAWQVLLRGGRRQLLNPRSPFSTATSAVLDGARGRGGPRRENPPNAKTLRFAVGQYCTPALPIPETRLAHRARPVRVLQTYMAPLPFHNPYVKLHDRSLEQTGEVEVMHFSWRQALSFRYDVVHAHWPEDVLEAANPLKASVKRGCMALWLFLLSVRGIPIVRTVHNLELPSDMGPFKRALLLKLDRQTSHRVLLSNTTPVPKGPYSVVLHGHYIDWFEDYPPSQPIDGRIAYFGLVRRYKNVESLATTFVETEPTHPEWSLQIAGRPSSDQLVAALSRIIANDARVMMTLRYLSDAEIVDVVTSARLILLPYREMHNSGSLLTALSLGRPALVPDNATNRAIADEVGPGWVYLYRGDLAVADLQRVMAKVGDRLPTGFPELSPRSWRVSARGHLAAYRTALEANQ